MPIEQSSTHNVEVALPISGMTCASCVRRVERALGRTPGVEAVSVSLVAGLAIMLAMILPLPIDHEGLFLPLFVIATPIQLWAG